MEQRTGRPRRSSASSRRRAANQEQIEFLQRQLSEFTSKNGRTEIDGVIVLDKAAAGAATVRLNYLVERVVEPALQLRSNKPKDPVAFEYLAAVEQKTGEDWIGVSLVLSTASRS